MRCCDLVQQVRGSAPGPRRRAPRSPRRRRPARARARAPGRSRCAAAGRRRAGRGASDVVPASPTLARSSSARSRAGPAARSRPWAIGASVMIVSIVSFAVHRRERVLGDDLQPPAQLAPPRPPQAVPSGCRRCAPRPALGSSSDRPSRPSVDFPEPLSPTSPSVSPAPSDERHVVDGPDRERAGRRASDRNVRETPSHSTMGAGIGLVAAATSGGGRRDAPAPNGRSGRHDQSAGRLRARDSAAGTGSRRGARPVRAAPPRDACERSPALARPGRASDQRLRVGMARAAADRRPAVADLADTPAYITTMRSRRAPRRACRG